MAPRPNVGYLLGRGGLTVQKLRKETNAQIRVQDHGPQCVSLDDQLIKVKGDCMAVKKAVERITDLLKESLQNDHLRGHLHLPHRFFPTADEFMASPRGRSPSRAVVHPSYDPIVFRIICQDDKIGNIMDQLADGIGRLLREEVGVDVRVGDPVPSLDGHVVIITSHEVKGDCTAVKKAVERITDLLKESLQNDHLCGHLHLPHRFFPTADEFMASPRGHSPSRAVVHPSYDPIVFRIICRDDKVGNIMDQSADGIGRLLREEVGVDVRVGDPVPSLDGHVVSITSHEVDDISVERRRHVDCFY